MLPPLVLFFDLDESQAYGLYVSLAQHYIPQFHTHLLRPPIMRRPFVLINLPLQTLHDAASSCSSYTNPIAAARSISVIAMLELARNCDTSNSVNECKRGAGALGTRCGGFVDVKLPQACRRRSDAAASHGGCSTSASYSSSSSMHWVLTVMPAPAATLPVMYWQKTSVELETFLLERQVGFMLLFTVTTDRPGQACFHLNTEQHTSP
ncbi:hypothetical protein FA95DRAFT_51672 [Auriscalpium vulgare]|uniref:Uncharacterized protein n=1 Tax=Auriscalpium vulgare TaxID=40419 RepID=A0ACB8S7A8_9AGAM|nr:hypothetical protein FA95DRAFT_51672 [Auriscalpium vulgare]